MNDQNDITDEEIQQTEIPDEFKEKYLRALADYQNLERQTQIWKDEFVKFANTGLIRKLLEILDDLEKAQEHLADDGLSLVIAKFKKTLADEGVEELNLEGKEYNPQEAEVISTEIGEENNIIIKVLQKGYKLKDKIIRPAKVVVTVTNTNE